MRGNRQQHVAEGGDHAAVADAHQVAMPRLDAKSQQRCAGPLLHVQRTITDEAAAEAARPEASGTCVTDAAVGQVMQSPWRAPLRPAPPAAPTTPSPVGLVELWSTLPEKNAV
jgi:hypothetical protein